jgi:hypothetical protein
MTRMRLFAAMLAVPALAITGCSSSGSGKHSAAPNGSSSAAGTATTRAVAAQVRKGIDGLTSAHVSVKAGVLLDSLTGELALKSGTVTASNLVVGTGSAAATVISVGTASYAKLPAGQNTSGKPWIKVSATSKNEFARGLASTLSVVQAATSLSGVADLVTTATDLKTLGPASVGTITAIHYSFTVHGSTSGSPLSKMLAIAGAAGVPSELWLDSAGRPVQIKLTIAAANVSALIALSQFNAPLSITAPPENQVLSS